MDEVVIEQSGVPVTRVIMHCAAINTRQFDGLSAFDVFAEINRWHLQRGFAGFGYHLLIMPSGEIFDGRPLHQVGAHCLNNNLGTWGVLLIEGKKIEEIAEFSDYFTEDQRLALRDWLARYPQIVSVAGHNDFAPRLCPGFKVVSDEWL